jgi:uncharacterized protein YjgD (DUF1641 family)
MTLTTADAALGRRLDELDAKVDRLTELLEQNAISKAATGDLVAEAGPILRSAYESTAARLDGRSIDIEAVTSLLLKLGEMAPELEALLDTARAGTALVGEMSGLSAEAFEKLIAATEELDRRGYFTWIRGGVELLDRIITGFDEEDMQALSDNVVLIFETVKEMTQPEVMRMLQRSARMMREDVEPPKKLSMFRLMRELRDPEVKLAIYRTLTMLKGMSGPTVADPTDTTDQPSEHSAKEE